MTRAFGKRIRVVVGRAGQEGVEIGGGLRISYKITKTDGAEPNVAQVSVWGLSQETAEATRERDTLIQVYAGYGEQEWLLFLGAVTRSATTRDGVETVTEIESGKASLGGAPLSKTLTGQQGLGDVLKIASDGLGALGVDVSQVEGVVNAPRGISLSGDPAAVLNKLTRANRLDWTIEDGIVRFIPRGQPGNAQALLLTPDTGLIASPKSMQMQLGTGSKRAGVELKSVLQGQARIRGVVQVEDVREMAGWYLIRRIVHEGDLWGAEPMMTTMECTPIEARGA